MGNEAIYDQNAEDVLDYLTSVMLDNQEQTSERIAAAERLGSYYGLWDGRGWTVQEGAGIHA